MKFAQTFRGVPKGAIYPIEYQPGDECPPELETAARSVGALDEQKVKQGNKGSK